MAHAAGTLFVLRSGGFVGWAIRLMTRSRVNHAGVCLGNGDTVEAQAAGAVRKQEQDKAGVNMGTALHDYIEACAPGRGRLIAAEAEMMLGTPYGFLDLVALAWASLKDDPSEPPAKPNWWQARVMTEEKLICSQLVDQACLCAGVHLFTDGRLPGQVTPGDLAEVFAHPDSVKVEVWREPTPL